MGIPAQGGLIPSRPNSDTPLKMAVGESFGQRPTGIKIQNLSRNSAFFHSTHVGSKATKHFTSFQNYRGCGKAEGKTQSDNYSLHQDTEVAGPVPSLLCDRNKLGPPYHFKPFHFPSLPVFGYFLANIEILR